MPKILGIPTPRIYLSHPRAAASSLILQLRYHYQGQPVRMRYFPGEVVEVKYWDARAARAKFGGPYREEYAELNDRLSRLAEITKAIWKENDRGNISPADFADELDYRLGRKERPQDTRPTLAEFVAAYLAERKAAANAKQGTTKVLQLWINHLTAYAADRGRALDYDLINWEFFNDFQNWLCEPERMASQNHIAKGISVVRQLMREAERRGYHNNTAYRDMKAKTEKTVKFALSFDELETLFALDLAADKSLEKARDLFLIAAYTGLRHSDFNRIRPDHIATDDGHAILSITTAKTATPVQIPLFPQAEAILSKYKFHPPRMSDQFLNRSLKVIGRLAGLDDPLVIDRTAGGKRTETTVPKYERLTSHVGRRSFATNFFLLGVPAAMLMQITGHATERQFMQYVAIDGRRNAKALAREVALKMAERKLRVV